MTLVEQSNIDDLSEQIRDQPLNCSIYTDFDSVDLSQEQWDNFIVSVGCDIYQSFDWCKIWWSYYGSGRNLIIFVVRSGEKVLGIIPMFIDKIRLGIFNFHLAKLVSCDFSLNICRLAIEEKHMTRILSIILNKLFQDYNCDSVWFGPLCEEETVKRIKKVCSDLSDELIITRDKIATCDTIFMLPKTIEEYLQNINKNHRSNYNRTVNLMNRSHKITYDCVKEPEPAEKEFDNFIQLHEKQWRAEGKLGHFKDWPMGEEFNRTMLQVQSRLGRLRLYRILADGKVIYYHYSYVFGGKSYRRLPAREIGEPWDKYSLGKISLLKQLEEDISEGISEVEGGIGHYDYKLSLGGKEIPVHSLLITPNTWWKRLCCRFFSFHADLFHLLYYRIWFNRLRPKLGIKADSLWPSWIRRRL
jgi:CelD/BcsL family acetyltransferase involved in cellulose biosynthesis